MGPPADIPVAETRADIETDHLDAADDGGPRTWGLALRPLQLDLGIVGAELGVAAGSNATVTLEVDWRALDPGKAHGVALGVALFPSRFAFHGFYVHPRLESWHAVAGATSRDAVAAGALVGYQWTAPVGASLKVGAGLAYGTWLPARGPQPAPGVLPEIDVAVGWAF
jgi:hypothetical protein